VELDILKLYIDAYPVSLLSLFVHLLPLQHPLQPMWPEAPPPRLPRCVRLFDRNNVHLCRSDTNLLVTVAAAAATATIAHSYFRTGLLLLLLPLPIATSVRGSAVVTNTGVIRRFLPAGG